eukprot:CAMPEP_0176070036 /NCGR_PEP_ID=MMETSP0120_2-20121206/34971_1 /TAXON_ID=160619 /ORGANISM="Kryptoperidinium foliaceum, Strain CCMP 1326" /LENGTH=388 /DNA_ID=CAMNT_0017403675 /DNA_START=10 /DNA_END=1176 /DNA_ORIENTATION=+
MALDSRAAALPKRIMSGSSRVAALGFFTCLTAPSLSTSARADAGKASAAPLAGWTRLDGISVDCDAGNTTVPSAWDDGACLVGAAAGNWKTEDCTGAFSCKHRQTNWMEPHLVYAPEGECSSLVVFLPGTGSKPSAHSRVLRAAAAAGHCVIGLSYLSQPVPVARFNAWCRHGPGAPPEACNRDAHERMLFGTAPPDVATKSAGLWDVTPVDSMKSILRAALLRLSWGRQFLTGEQGVRWSKVILSGHSQGAGHAAYLSILKDVRAVLLSGPQDCAECSEGWLARATPVVTRRALFHMHEECGPEPDATGPQDEAGLILQNLVRMGLRTQPTVWTGKDLEPRDREIVISDLEPSCQGGRSFHMSISVDSCAPRSERMDALWTSLFSDI